MKQLNFYKYAVVGLVVLNLAILSFFIFAKPQPPQRPSHRESPFALKAPKILQLNESQNENFHLLAKAHDSQMKDINRRQGVVLKSYFNTLLEVENGVNRDSLLQVFQGLETEKVRFTYQHFEDVKEILTDDQKPNFDKFMKRALSVILLHDKKPPPPQKGF